MPVHLHGTKSSTDFPGQGLYSSLYNNVITEKNHRFVKMYLQLNCLISAEIQSLIEQFKALSALIDIKLIQF